MLMKARDDGAKPGTTLESAAQPCGPGASKMEKEGQRPTQPVYQIQNRGMAASASSSAVDREYCQHKTCISVLTFELYNAACTSSLCHHWYWKVKVHSSHVTFSHGWPV